MGLRTQANKFNEMIIIAARACICARDIEIPEMCIV